MFKYIIDRDDFYIRIAQLYNDSFENLWIEEKDDRPSPGDIYVGRIEKVLKKNRCAFINIGVEKNVFLPLDAYNMNIKTGENIIVEIIKEEIEDKGAFVTDKFNIPGTYAVLKAKSNKIEFSSKLKDESKKKDIKEKLKDMSLGVVIRTAAGFVDVNTLIDDIKHLEKEYENVMKKGKYALKPMKIYSSKGILDKVLKTIISQEAEIIVNTQYDYKMVEDFINRYNAENIKITMFNENTPIFGFYGLENSITDLLLKKVQLKCGGHLIINKTEALTTIDVNTGSNVKGNNKKEINYYTNLEAAKECARHIKLRNLSGIIVIDFINMSNKEHKENVIKKLDRELKRDINKSKVYPLTELDLLQLTRRRQGNSIYEILNERIENLYYSIERIKLKYLIKLIKDDLKRHYDNGIKYFKLSLNNIYEVDNKEEIKEIIDLLNIKESNIKIDFNEKKELYKLVNINYESEWNKLKN